MGDVLVRLRVDDRPVADLQGGDGLDPVLVPRPYLHPVRTLGGVRVTDARPADHPWHLGVGVAVPDVDGANLWGGPTFRPDEGYVPRHDHGRIVHLGFDSLDAGGFTARLRWLGPDGRRLIAEERRVRARPAGQGWELSLVSTLRNAAPHPLPLGSPATNGRAGAGYGGLFWRLAPAGEPEVRTATAVGEDAVQGSVAPWLLWTDRARTASLVFHRSDGADPWFVRLADYPGVGLQLAGRTPLVLPVGGTVTRGMRVLVADGLLDAHAAAAWAGAAVGQTPR